MYKFPLASVLNYKKLVEEILHKELSILKKILIDDSQAYSNISNNINKLFNELQDRQKKYITLSEMKLYIGFIDHLSDLLKIQKEKLLTSQNNVDNKRYELINAMKNTKILENLKLKGYEVYKQGIMRKEQAFINEMASVRFKNKIQD